MIKAFVRTTGLLTLAAMLALSVAACGKKSNPKAPSESSQFPSQYPTE